MGEGVGGGGTVLLPFSLLLCRPLAAERDDEAHCIFLSLNPFRSSRTKSSGLSLLQALRDSFDGHVFCTEKSWRICILPKVSAERKYFPRLWRVLICKSQGLGGKLGAPRKGNQLPQLSAQHPFQPLTHLPQAWLLTRSSPISACFLPWRVPSSPPDPSPPSPHSVSLE